MKSDLFARTTRAVRLMGITVVALCLAAPAMAATLATFDDLPQGVVASPLVRLSGMPAEAMLDATGGLYADGAGILSTVLDAAPITMEFGTAQTSLILTGGVVDAAFDWISGEILLSAEGGLSQTFALGAGASQMVFSPEGMAFKNVSLSLSSFDIDASSVGFVALTALEVPPVPLPASLPMLLAACAAMAGLARRSKCRHTIEPT